MGQHVPRPVLTRTTQSEATIRRAITALQTQGVLTCESYRDGDAGIGGQPRTDAVLWGALSGIDGDAPQPAAAMTHPSP